MTTRSIAAMQFLDLKPGQPATDKPVLEWMNPTDLMVDADYQRDLSPRSKALIRKIIENWDWRKLKPPIVAMTDAGFVVVDGQHTCLAAASHPDIDEIPVVIVIAADQQAQAASFVGHNRDRIAMSASELHAANVVAGDELAVTVAKACERAGVTLVRNTPARGVFEPNSAVAASTISACVRRRGADAAAVTLGVLAQAGFAPIKADHVKAVDYLLFDKDGETVDPLKLAQGIINLGIQAEGDAQKMAKTNGYTLWRGYVRVWRDAAKKSRKRAAGETADASLIPPTPAQLPLSAAPAGLDRRPALNGWVPGALKKRCSNCETVFYGDIDASMCADCAYGTETARAA